MNIHICMHMHDCMIYSTSIHSKTHSTDSHEVTNPESESEEGYKQSMNLDESATISAGVCMLCTCMCVSACVCTCVCAIVKTTYYFILQWKLLLVKLLQ